MASHSSSKTCLFSSSCRSANMCHHKVLVAFCLLALICIGHIDCQSNEMNENHLTNVRRRRDHHSSSGWAANAHDGSQNDDNTLNEAPATNVPEIESKAQNLTVEEGTSIELPCIVKDLGPFVQLWRKGSNLLFAGNLQVFRDSRVTLKESNLVIETLHLNDTGPYICQVSTNPTIEITHHLIVEPPRPTEVPNRISNGQYASSASSFSSLLVSIMMPMALVLLRGSPLGIITVN